MASSPCPVPYDLLAKLILFDQYLAPETLGTHGNSDKFRRILPELRLLTVEMVAGWSNYWYWSPVSQCPHHFYGSTQLFVDHICWYLQQDLNHRDIRCIIGIHTGVIWSLLLGHSLCSRCRNLMISSEQFMYCIYTMLISRIDNDDKKGAISTRYCLFFRLVDHPRMARVLHKLLPKVMRRSSVLKLLLFHTPKISQVPLPINPIPKLKSISVAYIEFLSLCTKYWKRHNFKRIMNSMVKTESLVLFSHPSTDCTFDEMNRSKTREDVKQRTRCSSVQCDKPQSDSKEQFKLCGGCRFTYYCCRSCQKRAWPQHKPICATLRRVYNL